MGASLIHSSCMNSYSSCEMETLYGVLSVAISPPTQSENAHTHTHVRWIWGGAAHFTAQADTSTQTQTHTCIHVLFAVKMCNKSHCTEHTRGLGIGGTYGFKRRK